MADDYYNPEALEEGERNEQQDEQQYEPSKHTIIVLIDASPMMLEMVPTRADEDAEEVDEEEVEATPISFLSVAINAVVKIMRWRILHAPADEIGVMFYGADHSNVDAAFEAVHELVPLEAPEAATIHKLQEFTDDAFRRDVGSRAAGTGPSTSARSGEGAAADLRYGLWAAKDKLGAKTKSSMATYRRLFIFTCDEDPTGGDRRNRELLDQRLDDLHHQRIGLDVFPLLALKQPFDMAAFWNHASQVAAGQGDESDAEGDDEGTSLSALSQALPAVYSRRDVASYLDDVARRTTASRPTASLQMHFPGGLKIAVRMYSLLRPAEKPSKIKITKEEYKAVATSTAYFQPDGHPLSDMNKRAIHLKTKSGVDRIPRAIYDNKELEMARAPRPAGLQLLGFAPSLSFLAPHYVTATARFLYPDERALRGSTAAFVALHRALHKQDKVAVGRLVVREGNAPTLVVLQAQVEEVGPEGDQVTPPGLNMMQLPWRDELRYPERGGARGAAKVTSKPVATQEQVDAACALVSSMALDSTFRHTLKEIRNPSLLRHYDALEKLALGYGTEELAGQEPQDDTLPDDMEQHQPVIDAFSDAVYGEGGAGTAGKTAGAKRKAEPDPHVQEMYAERDWYSLAESDKLGRLTNDQLKVYLRYHKMTLGGPKAELIARIKTHVLANPR